MRVTILAAASGKAAPCRRGRGRSPVCPSRCPPQGCSACRITLSNPTPGALACIRCQDISTLSTIAQRMPNENKLSSASAKLQPMCVLIPPPPPTWLLSASRSPHSPASQRLRPRRWARRRTPGTARAAALTAAAAPDGRGGSSVAVATCGARSRSEICWGCRHAPSKPLAAFSHGATRQSRRGTVSQVTAVHPPVSPLCAACCAGVPVLPAGTRHPSRRLPRVKAETSIHRKQRLYSSCCEQQIV